MVGLFLGVRCMFPCFEFVPMVSISVSCRLSLALHAQGRIPEVDNEREMGIETKYTNGWLPV